jgi:hypothetical protein
VNPPVSPKAVLVLSPTSSSTAAPSPVAIATVAEQADANKPAKDHRTMVDKIV